MQDSQDPKGSPFVTPGRSSAMPPLVLGLIAGLAGGLLGGSVLSMVGPSASSEEQIDALTKQVAAYEGAMAELKQQVATQALALAETKAAAPSNANANQQVAAVSDEAIRAYLVNNPDVIFMDALDVFQANEPVYTARRFSKLLDSGLRDPLYHSASDPYLGNPDGDVVLVEFFDYNCGYCKSVAPGLFDSVQADGNVKLVMKEYPILSKASQVAAQAALASQKQNLYNEYHTALIKHQGRVTEDVVFQVAKEVGLDIEQLKVDMQSSLVQEKLAQTQVLASQLGVTGTPAFMVGDTFLPGAVPSEQIESAIARTRAQASKS